MVDCEFAYRSGQTKDYLIGICCFSAKHKIPSGATSGAGTAYTSGAPEFASVFTTCISGVHVVHTVKLHIFTFLVLCCDIRYDFHIKTMFGSPYLPFVLSGIKVSMNGPKQDVFRC